jgi:phytoene synthase
VSAAAALISAEEQRAVTHCREVLEEKSKSFALATRLLPPWCRDQFAVIYAFCRYVDDAIDLAPQSARPAAMAVLYEKVALVYAGIPTGELTLDAFSSVARVRRIPRYYVDELLAGMEMDVLRAPYPTLESLYQYAHRVAGVVGLLLCHVMGVSDERALKNAAHLGLAMQLTNICRDIEEDLRDGRVYLPDQLLGAPLVSVPDKGSERRKALSGAVARLLDEADGFYDSADRGLLRLPWRCALAIRTARLVYAAIGDRLRARGCDPFGSRAYVSGFRKGLLVIRAIALSLLELPQRGRAIFRAPEKTLRFPDDVLPLLPGDA